MNCPTRCLAWALSALLPLAACDDGGSGTKADTSDVHPADAPGDVTTDDADTAEPPLGPPERTTDGRWTEDYAWRWWNARPWPVGFNYIPRTAVNELEMWQAETFDVETIDEELGWAEDIGFNTLRVFLHDKLWEQDSDGFVERIDTFLGVADAHGFTTMLVLFDNVWGETSELGPQPDPIPGVHNSQWVQSPEAEETRAFPADPELRERLEEYVKGVVGAFADDPRVLMWDTVNEAGNTGISEDALPLVEATFGWIREVAPTQPATSGVFTVYNDGSELHRKVVALSDIISFHTYYPPDMTSLLMVDRLDIASSRPQICTEYMARTAGSLFEEMMPYLHERDIGAVHWGFVAGRTQTYYSWTSPEGAPEPDVWFHDVLRADGTPYDADEVAFLRDFLANAFGEQATE